MQWKGLAVILTTKVFMPNQAVIKNLPANAGDTDLIPGLGRPPGEGKEYPLQYSGLENSMDCIVHGVAKSQTRLNHFHFQHDPIRRSKQWNLQWVEVGGPPSARSRKCRQKCQRIGSWTGGDAIPALMWMVHADDFQFAPLLFVSWFSRL